MNLSKITLALFTVGTLSFLPLSANATAQTARATAAPVADSTLKERVNTRLDADASLKKFDIAASVSNGVVTLTGKVRTAAEKTRAARTANITGVTKVVNQITLDKDAGRDMETKVKDATSEAGSKVKSAAETTGEKTKEGLSKTGEVITDAWIITKVKADFVGENALKGSDINVDVKDRSVTLKGTVKSQAGRARAIAIAKGTEGVKTVNDQLRIVP